MQQNIQQEPPNVLVIGVGNEFRSDDAVGLEVAKQLMKLNLPGVAIVEEKRDVTDLIQTWKRAPSVILIDAMRTGIEPGTVLKFDLLRDEIPARYFQHSTHAFDITDAVRLARTLGELPSHLELFGVEGEFFDAGVGLTPHVAKSASELVQRIVHECDRLTNLTLHHPYNL